jgi:hypothetical protein
MLNVPPAEWRTFFDRMSKALLGKWAEIEVASLELGDQIVAEWVPLLGITYDSRDDLVDVASVAVIDQDGARQVVKLKEPLMLPAAATAG